MSCQREELLAYTRQVCEREEDVLTASGELVGYYLRNAKITVPKQNRFWAQVDCLWLMEESTRMRAEKTVASARELAQAQGERNRAYSGFYDFGHTSPDWESIVSLGIWGLCERIKEYERENTDPVRERFYAAARKSYEGGLDLILRVAMEARRVGKEEMAEGLEHLAVGAPTNLFEAMQTTLIYYTMQVAEGAIVRTLGRLDGLYLDFYKREGDAGYTEELIRDFLREIDGLRAGSNIPFALGATPSGAHSTALTVPFLRGYRATQLRNTKIHLLCRRDVPREILEEAFECIREGENSILFMSDERVIESLTKLLGDGADARNYHVVGCYECGAMGELTCSCAARVNLPKAVEYALSGGIDLFSGEQIGLDNDGVFEDFDAFFGEVVRQAEHLISCAMTLTEHYEREYHKIFAAPVFSSTYDFALKSGRDFYCANGARYNDTSLNALGLATAVDSLESIRILVFEEKRLSVRELCEILRSDFRENELLRLRICNRFPKYGVGDKKTDALAHDLVAAVARATNGRANARGGVWRLGTFSIDWRWNYGKYTAASADGRHKGEPISQNSGAAFGSDKEGALAHMRSVAAVDSSLTPNGTVLDLDLHCSAVVGKNGLCALVDGLLGFFSLGGFSVHYNVLNTEVLREAKACPDKYPNLQVRLCGWNVLFSSLSEREKEEFIFRSEVGAR